MNTSMFTLLNLNMGSRDRHINPQTNDRHFNLTNQRSPLHPTNSDRHIIHNQRSPSHSTNQRSQLTSNQTAIAYFPRHYKCSKRLPLIPQTSDRPLNSHNQRSPQL
ncbi:hypothetical protein H6F44_02620 [Pseudanabaena sp. FACHB-1277]|uniref:Uncharacterized protein n=1 Tax=Pseudanabaena cinerea FACHB-1277 TaxID=2949581 RepID=A0A926UQ52_9CYAN|nr:hypothetical protein [Pseudanabaena cinerea]MBD2149024.1 hypothetical protein [Pseudanabaena cinerea FACHB-1277]